MCVCVSASACLTIDSHAISWWVFVRCRLCDTGCVSPSMVSGCLFTSSPLSSLHPPPPLIFLVIYWLHIIQVCVLKTSWNPCVRACAKEDAWKRVSCSFSWNKALINSRVSQRGFEVAENRFDLLIHPSYPARGGAARLKFSLLDGNMFLRWLEPTLPHFSFLRWVSSSQTSSSWTSSFKPKEAAGGAFFFFPFDVMFWNKSFIS